MSLEKFYRKSDHWLREIVQINGVHGVFIATGRGDILYKLGLRVKNEQLAPLVVCLLRIHGVFHAKKKDVIEIELFWNDHYVNCRYAHNFMLVTLCGTPKVISLLRMTVNVALANILDDKDIMKEITSYGTNSKIKPRKSKNDTTVSGLISKVRLKKS
jgi:hypothetical protein